MQARTGRQPIATDFVIAVSDDSLFKSFLEKQLSVSTGFEYSLSKTFIIHASWKMISEDILSRPEVLFVDRLRIPHEEVAVSNLDLSVNKATTLHNRFPQYNGQAISVSVKENRPDTADIDFKGRYVPTTFVSAALSSHATAMATIIGGAGNTYYEGKGVAWGSFISSANFTTLLPEPDAVYQQYNISVQNHSYGTGIENFYGADAAAYDASVITRPSLLHVFSAGNSGTLASTTGAYAGITGFANLTGSFKMAKNIITVGHTDSLAVVLAPSSKGPAYDGRVKPELVAFGEDGSSGAAAIVSGIALTLQQAYKDLHGSLPSSALVKAVLLNSADDVGPAGIDYSTGFGSANALKAMQGLSRATESSINTGETQFYDLVIPSNCKRVKITLVWSDPPATPNAAKALRNDLDLELENTGTGQTWKPWVLSHFPRADSLQLLPVRKRDSLNNAEQVTLDNPAAGNYRVRITAFNSLAGSQPYSFAYQFDTLDKFTWYYPASKDNLFGNRSNTLRWESTYGTTTGQLEYSINNGNTWQQIDNAVDLNRGYYKWMPPDTFVTALLRMNIGVQNFRTDTFTISNRMDIYVGFNCPDSFLFFWKRVPGISSYQVYKLGDKYMEPLLVTTDTFVILQKQTNPSLYYAVAPLISGKTGVRSYGFNYTTQGVECYVRSFFAVLIGNAAQLDLELGSNYNIRKITWEKLTPAGYVALQSVLNISGLHFTYTDNSLIRGLNTYRVRIELVNGQVIYSNPATVYYLANDLYLVYPNPAPQYQSITLLSIDSDITHLQVYNSVGVLVYTREMDVLVNTIPAGKLSKGLYLLRIIKENRTQAVLKLIVQ